jgi:hypothetical protein
MVTALDAPATRRCLRRRWLGCAALALGAILLVGLVAWLRHADHDATERDGERATGTVETLEMRSIGGHTSGTLGIRFADDDGISHLAEVPLDERIRRFAAGDAVEVAYPVGRPDDVVLVGITEQAPMPWIVPALGAAVLAAIAADVAVRLRRCTKVLARNPWVAVRSREIQVPLGPGGGGVMAVLELDGAPDDGLTLAVAASVRARPMADVAGDTWVAGDDRRFYLAAAGGAPVVRAKRVRLIERAGNGVVASTPLHSRLRPGH